MSTTVTYKGSTLTTVNNQTRVLNTTGRWLEGDITLTDVSAASPTLITKNINTNGTYNASSDSADGFSQVVVNVPTGITPTGTKQINITQNGTTTEDVTNYASAQITVNVSGETPSATRHTLYFEFEDETTETEYSYYDDAFISNAIRATTPTTRNNKTVTSAQLDGVEWYSYDPTSSIPLNTQLIDFNSITNGYTVAGDGSLAETEWFAVTDYTEIDPSMTFSYRGAIWFNLGFYDSSKAAISTIYIYSDATADPDNDQVGVGTLTPAKIPANAKYVRISCVQGANADYVSLIRTA